MTPLLTPKIDSNCEMSQSQVAEKLFVKQQTICKIEKKARENFIKILAQKGYKIEDLLYF